MNFSILMKHILGMLLAVMPVLSAFASDILPLSGDNWTAVLDAKRGVLLEYTQYGSVVPFRVDDFAGPTWEGVEMSPCDGAPLSFRGNKDGNVYTIKYIPMSDHLAVECGMLNETSSTFAPMRASLVIGTDSEMRSYPLWNDKYFPTLLRCERDFAWGYFMSPLGGIMAVGVEDPVASYSLNYIYRDIKEWKWGHQIYTASWDMLHCGPLPSRHPSGMAQLLPGENKTWTMHLGCVARPEDVKPALSSWLSAPLMEADKYTLVCGENDRLTVYSSSDLTSLTFTDTKGRSHKLKASHIQDSVWTTVLPALRQEGLCRIVAVNACGKRSEAILNVRGDWSRYLSQARDFVMKYPPVMGNSCEMFYGYYPAFLAFRHFPSQDDAILEERLLRDMTLLIEPETGLPAKDANPHRVQNFSSLMGILVDLYEATGKEEYLQVASRIGDYISSESIQAADGSYRSGNIHYTAVIYPAKSMLELAEAEKAHFETTADSTWLAHYSQHYDSAMRAVEDLARRLDNIETEGDMTFEDGMISCSALQLALGALNAEDTATRDRYCNAASYMLERHRCLEQNLIPDARMRGATLRYWEALDVYFTPNQVMNSPHGWTAWKIYAVYYMYLLTGDLKYWNDLNDTLGSCVQLMTADGYLRWGFIPDPYMDGRICVSDGKGGIDYKDKVIGEQYLEMISPWLRPADETKLCNFGEIGGAGDHTVYEIFKALEETMISTAYVRVESDGRFNALNCRARLRGDSLYVSTDRHTRRLHVCTSNPLQLSVNGGETQSLSSCSVNLTTAQ